MSLTAPSATPRVALHVGAPKSGTTFLQRALWKNRDGLRAVGVTCPGERARDMFVAAIEIREAATSWGYDQDAIAGTWARLCGDARSFAGTTVMSHELLSAGRPEQVATAFAGLEGLETHLVITVRDLARQVTSEWQERIKNGSTGSFRKFARGVVRQVESGDFSSLFWRYQHVVGITDRWAADLPPERVHIVVAPPSGAAPDLLWRRFGEAVGFDGAQFDPATGVTNQTLGPAQVAVLRRVNRALEGRIRQPRYAKVVKSYFAQQVLASQPAAKPGTPARLVELLAGVAESVNAEVLARGYRVHGDLAELIPPVATQPGSAPDRVSREEEIEAAARAIADLLVDRADRRSRDPEPEVVAAAPLGRRVIGRLRRSLG